MELFTIQASPSNVLVANGVPPAVFATDDAKETFKHLFLAYGEVPLTDFDPVNSRARIVFAITESAVLAQIRLTGVQVAETVLELNFGRRHMFERPQMQFLEVPALEKQFLISPPPSPPEGWEPLPEDPPVVNHELLAALAKMGDRPLELFSGTAQLPSICLQDFSHTGPDCLEPPPPQAVRGSREAALRVPHPVLAPEHRPGAPSLADLVRTTLPPRCLQL